MTTFPLLQSGQKSDLAPLFGDLSQGAKLSEIKSPLDRDKYVIM